jgi:hypothetical protein
VTEGKAQDFVNGAALVVAGIYFYRKLIEPATGVNAAASSAGGGATPEAGDFDLQRVRWRGPAGNYAAPGEPATIPGATAQLFGKGDPPSLERFVVGWGFVFLTLSLSVTASPQLAASFASLVAVGSVLGNGTQVAKDLETQLHRKPSRQAADVGQASPTTPVVFAGSGASTATALMPQAAPRQKKPRSKPKFKVQSA